MPHTLYKSARGHKPMHRNRLASVCCSHSPLSPLEFVQCTLTEGTAASHAWPALCTHAAFESSGQLCSNQCRASSWTVRHGSVLHWDSDSTPHSVQGKEYQGTYLLIPLPQLTNMRDLEGVVNMRQREKLTDLECVHGIRQHERPHSCIHVFESAATTYNCGPWG
jgi:hypothetical protein